MAEKAPEESFQAFMEWWVERRFGSAQKLADEIKMTVSALSRGVRLQGSLGVDKLLRFAMVTGESPSKVLRLAGKQEVAELIEQLYGQPREGPSRDQRELLALWTDIDEEARSSLMTILRGLSPRVKQRKTA